MDVLRRGHVLSSEIFSQLWLEVPPEEGFSRLYYVLIYMVEAFVAASAISTTVYSKR
jgi:hypothetical protein